MSCNVVTTDSDLRVFISSIRSISTIIRRISQVIFTNGNTTHCFCIIKLTQSYSVCYMGCIFRTNSNGVLTICIIVVTSSKGTCTSSISIYTHSGCTCTSCTGVITYYSRIFTCRFWCCLPRAFGVINIIVGTNSNSSLSIGIIYITKSNRSFTRSSITRTNGCCRTTCSFIFITYSCRSVICGCIFSTNCYFTIMASYVISSILIAYNDRVLTNIIVLTIALWTCFCPDINMAIASIYSSHCLLRSNAAHSASYS